MIKQISRDILFIIKKINLKHTKKVIIHKKSFCNKNTVFEGGNSIGINTNIYNTSLGYGTYLGDNCKIINTKIGRYCSIANNVKTIIATHPTKKYVTTHPAFFSLNKQAGFTYVNKQKVEEIKYIDKENNISVIIGNDVWIGENVTILGGVSVGDGAIIGANSLVTKNVDSYSIVAGIPAKIIRYRFEKNDIEFLKKTKWWDKPEKWIVENKDLFDDINKLKEVLK